MAASPPTSRFLRWGFRRYLLGGFPFGRGMLARNFHAVRLLEPIPVPFDDGGPGGPRVFYLNHPGWWDPLAAAALAAYLVPFRTPYAPIDAEALRSIPCGRALGLFGVERDAAAGARAFLRGATAALTDPAADLWLTPQGTFAPPERRPITFAPGLGHLLSRNPRLTAVPVAVRYDFWSERRPELLLAVGEPVRRSDVPTADDTLGQGTPRSEARGDAPVRSGECSRFLEGRLEDILSELSAASADRDPGRFRPLRFDGNARS
ncbi:lysophospholipid acyltransferase family protein [Alienimonas chondri]|uniref:Phospholipid/glycerol acyltransferase domain-containing protein n=1 Tax=Alienimonas chondri TaxID=2681879 RepID=A0ABX1VBH3_9PLAN|nr:lysophospholipid acyltransferase family protein [Alienimonas chondri]NNJ24845.1 hypothetical protein [Alienimonas chondri]